MKEWKKSLGPETGKYYDYLIALIVVTGITGFVLNETFLFVPMGLLIGLGIFGKIFDIYSGRNVTLINVRENIRMFPGEKTQLTVSLQNNSRVPIVNGRLHFSTDTQVTSERKIAKETQRGYHYEVPLSLIRKGETSVTLPLTAQHRGVTRLKGIQFRYPHLTRFHTMGIAYQLPYRTEVIVYPEQKEVLGIEEVFQLSPGEQTAQISPFEDILTPIGTRDYVSSDPFHRIHWKASAKTQELQTKVYERQVDISWTILINVTEYSRLGNLHISEKLEDLLSYASYLSHYAAKHSYPFELAVNLRRPHDRPYYYQPEGSGPAQLKDTLELLARIRKEHLLMSMEELMHRMNQQLYKKKTILILGGIPDHCQHYLKEWQRKGIRTFVLHDHDETAMLMPASVKGNAV